MGTPAILRVSWILLLVFAPLSVLLLRRARARPARPATCCERRRQRVRPRASRTASSTCSWARTTTPRAARSRLASATGREWDRDRGAALRDAAQDQGRLPRDARLPAARQGRRAARPGADPLALRRTPLPGRLPARPARAGHPPVDAWSTCSATRSSWSAGSPSALLATSATPAPCAPCSCSGSTTTGSPATSSTRSTGSVPAPRRELREVLTEEMHSGEHLHLDPAAVVLGLIGDASSSASSPRGSPRRTRRSPAPAPRPWAASARRRASRR